MSILSRRALFSQLGLWLVVAGSSSCKSAGIKDVYTARDPEGRLKTRVFRSDRTSIYLIVEFVSGREDAVLLVNLVPPEGSNARFEQDEIAPGKGDHKINIKLEVEDENGLVDVDGPWVSGTYSASVFIDGEFDTALSFTVE